MDNNNPNQTNPGQIIQNQPIQREQPPSQPNPPAFIWPIFYGGHMKRLWNKEEKQKLWKAVNSQDQQLFDDFHPFGNVFFNNQIKANKNIQLLNYEAIRMLKWDSWFIQLNKSHDVFLWSKIFLFIKQTTNAGLQFKFKQRGNVKFSIFRQIEPIGWYGLKTLTLYKCGIDTIEPLSHLIAPKLQTLNFIYNNAFQYKSFQKSIFCLKNLYILSMDEEQILTPNKFCIRLDHYSRWNFELKDLRLEKHWYNSVIMNDLAFVAKGKRNQKISEVKFCVSRRSRIQQKKVVQRFKGQSNVRFEIWEILNPVTGDPVRTLEQDQIDMYLLRGG